MIVFLITFPVDVYSVGNGRIVPILEQIPEIFSFICFIKLSNVTIIMIFSNQTSSLVILQFTVRKFVLTLIASKINL